MTTPYVPLDARGWRMAMGLRPLEMARWLEIDARRDEELALKSRLLREVPETVVATQPAGDAPSAELYGEVLAWLDAYGAPSRDVAPGVQDHPVVAAARLVQEDLCVLVRDDLWRLRAACVCFPSRWSLATKIGRGLDEIHAPVPGYRETLASATTGLFDRLSVDRPFWRLNWTVLDDPSLFQPEPAREATGEDVTQWHFRVERQTIRRLRRTGAIVFTIRSYVSPVAELAGQPEFLAHLCASIEGAPPATQSYKGWVDVARRLRDALG